ncbi:hypothetical protein DB32_003455 [Sandaracinus amylolyticus]|uniref:Uncharacterized protein n=1 Tax=Sandaracinus amylolyticus TaxID=927083 RepID=A0A0F6W360_9BACT|nr:hypothetical protein DB32_003455 [Sandaracinus amylolyticus]
MLARAGRARERAEHADGRALSGRADFEQSVRRSRPRERWDRKHSVCAMPRPRPRGQARERAVVYRAFQLNRARRSSRVGAFFGGTERGCRTRPGVVDSRRSSTPSQRA